MNPQLFFSSSFVGLILICSSLYYYCEDLYPFYIITYIGILTSIINHGISNTYAKYADRLTMCITNIIYIYYSMQIKDTIIKLTSMIVVSLMTTLYFFSKYIKQFVETPLLSTRIHMIAHILILIPFYIIIMNIGKSHHDGFLQVKE
jgi:hypothetical protein